MQYPGDPYTFHGTTTTVRTADDEPDGQWVTLGDAANRVGASQAALRQAVKDGTLRSRGSGRHVEVWIEVEGE